jgi:hypothetical protein
MMAMIHGLRGRSEREKQEGKDAEKTSHDPNIRPELSWSFKKGFARIPFSVQGDLFEEAANRTFGADPAQKDACAQ